MAAAEAAAAGADVGGVEMSQGRRRAPVSPSRSVRALPRLAAALAAVLLLCGGGVLPASAAGKAPPRQETFASPEDALKAVVADLKSGDVAGIVRIFGPGIEPVLNSGDVVEDKNARERFVAAAEEGHHFDGSGDTLTLVVGKDNWPFPIPLKKEGERWRFDTKAGKEELLDRRIGQNELATIQTMLAYVDAQRDFAELQRSRTGVAEYAQHILSTPGKRDGLYWPTAEGEPPSPLGPLVAEARAAGYRRDPKSAAPIPYHGYYFKPLTGQGPNAPGGEADYIVNGHMIGGFGLVAWPARYGDSGVMTFIVNHEGIVYQKDLGPETAKLAAAITRFDPGSGWQKTEP